MASHREDYPAAQDRVHSVACGCFRETELQGPVFGDDPRKAAGMSRPIG
jgi:hypothetical protein